MRYPSMMVDDWERLKKQWETCPVQRGRLEKEGEREMAQPVPAEHPRMSITFMALYMVNLALLYRLTDEKRYFDRCTAWMDAVCRYPGWGSDPRNVDVDLSASWVLWGLSVACDWLYGGLDSERRSVYAAAVSRHLHLFLAYVAAHQGDGWPTEYWQNHNWINMTGIAAAGWFLLRHGLDDEGAVALTERNFAMVFSVLPDDGSDYEGCCYWRYGGMWLFVYAALALGEGGADYFRSSAFLRNTFWYRLYQTDASLARNLNFGDTHDLYSSHPACVYYLVARMYRNGYARRLGDLTVTEFLADEAARSKVHPGILPEAGLEFLWFDPTVAPKDFSDLPLSREFPDLGLVSLRSGWDRNAVVFSTKCGCPGGAGQWERGWRLNRERGWRSMSLGHQHPDNLAYLLVIGDSYLIAEDGYNRAIAPSHHSVPLVDGRYADVMGVYDVWRSSAEERIRRDPSYRPEQSMRARSLPLRQEDGIWVCGGRAEALYPQDAAMRLVGRTFCTDLRSFLCIVTVMDSELAHRYTLVTNTYEAPVAEGPLRWRYPAIGVGYEVASSEEVASSVRVQTVSAVMTPQEPDKVTHVDQESLWTTSVRPCRRQEFVEVFAFPGHRAAVVPGSLRRIVVDGREIRIPAAREE